MTHSQPTPAPRRRISKLMISVWVVAIIAVGVAVGVIATRSPAAKHHAAATAPTTGVATTPAAPTPTPSTSAPTAPALIHEVVAAAAPTAFELKGAGFDIKAHVCGMDYIRPLDPPGEQHHTVCWVKEGFGVAPGTSSGTTYVLGHAWGQDDQEVLNDLSSMAMKQVLTEENKPVQLSGVDTWPVTAMNGYVLTLTTAKGTLKYTVKDVYAVRKSEAGYVKPLMDESTPNRVVIITCGELKHHDYDYNIIVDAYLTESIAKV